MRLLPSAVRVGSRMHPLQRMWRDASIAMRHGLVTTDPGLEIYGRALVGPEGNISTFI